MGVPLDLGGYFNASLNGHNDAASGGGVHSIWVRHFSPEVESLSRRGAVAFFIGLPLLQETSIAMQAEKKMH